MLRSSAIPRGLCLALLATAAQAQTVGAGARAVVNSDSLPVYNSMSLTSPVKATLTRGEPVTIGLVMFGDDVTWCAVSKSGDNRRLGYASCEFLESERNAASAPSASTAKKPITIREVPKEPISIPDAPSIPAGAASTPILSQAALPAAPEPVAPEPTTPSDARPPVETVATLREPALPVTPPAAPIETAKVEPPPPIAEAPPVPSAEQPPPTDAGFLDAVLDGSGLRSSLASYAENTHLLAFLDKGRLAEVNTTQLESLISKQFQPAVFYSAIEEQLRKSYSPERAPVGEWLRSPLAQKMADLERKALQPESRQELVEFAGSLTKSPPAESRLLLVHRLYDSMKTCDMEVQATISLVQTVALAMSPVLPKEKRYTAGELDKALGPVKSRYLSIMKNARLVRYLFAYRSVSDAEFEEYVNFLESENGKWFVTQVEKGFSGAGQAISRALGNEIPRNLKPKRL